MIAFFEDMCGRRHAISRVESFTVADVDPHISEEHARCKVRLVDGHEVESTLGQINAALVASRPITAAQPGTQLVTLWMPSYLDRSDWEVLKVPIFAWRCGEYGSLEPIPLDWDFKHLSYRHGVLSPDGTVSNVEGAVWSSLGEFVQNQFDAEVRSRASLLEKEEPST